MNIKEFAQHKSLKKQEKTLLDILSCALTIKSSSNKLCIFKKSNSVASFHSQLTNLYTSGSQQGSI